MENENHSQPDKPSAESGAVWIRAAAKIAASPRCRHTVAVIDMISTLLSAAAFITLLCYLLFTNFQIAVKVALISGSSFIIFSLIRYLIDAPRPYDLYDLGKSFYGKRPGRSFPSRHIFSAFLIATLTAGFCPYSAALLFPVCAVHSACRILSGLHFPRDVIAGAAAGALAGGLAILTVR